MRASEAIADENLCNTESIDDHNAHLVTLGTTIVQGSLRRLHRRFWAENLETDKSVLCRGLWPLPDR